VAYSCLQQRRWRLDKLTLAYTAATDCDSYCVFCGCFIACSYCVQCTDLNTTHLDVYLLEMLYFKLEYTVLSGFNGICIYIFVSEFGLHVSYGNYVHTYRSFIFFYWPSYYRYILLYCYVTYEYVCV